MKVIGLTGGIGSGKTTIAEYFQELGAFVIDADQVAHKIYELRPEVVEKILKKFGLEKWDPKKLAEIVFSDPQKKKELETLVHPLIRKEIQNQIEKAKKKNPPLIIVEAALMVETGYYRRFEGLIVIKARPEQQIERKKNAGGMSPEKIKNRMASQFPLSEKIKAATWVIDNSGSIEETKKQTRKLFFELTT